jgi:hypothetical protein
VKRLAIRGRIDQSPGKGLTSARNSAAASSGAANFSE